MKTPKCRLCGANHWSHEPHKFEDVKPEPKRKAPKKDKPKTLTPKDVDTNDSIPGQPVDPGPVDAKPVPTPAASEKPVPVNPSKKRASIQEQEREQKRAWRAKNRERYNAYMRQYMKDRRTNGLKD